MIIQGILVTSIANFVMVHVVYRLIKCYWHGRIRIQKQFTFKRTKNMEQDKHGISAVAGISTGG